MECKTQQKQMMSFFENFKGLNLSLEDLLCTIMADNSNTSSSGSASSLDPDFIHPQSQPTSHKMYAYITPLIIAIGLCGNLISFRVFTSTRLRKLSASLYLAALSTSDSFVLLTYVLFDWLLRGLPYWPGAHSIDLINIKGLCNLFLFSSYTFRFVSVYLIIIFTIERYIAVCHPLKRRIICTKSFARKVILSVFVAGMIIGLYKPFVSGLYPVTNNHWNDVINDTSNMTDLIIDQGIYICSNNPNIENTIFVLEILYGVTITAIPFIIVFIFNILLLRKLINHQMMTNDIFSLFRKSKIRIEFTVMVIAISTCFVCLNIPYFIVWIKQNIHIKYSIGTDDLQINSQYLRISRTVFNINYCINFFVYCLTGTYYRGIMQRVFRCGRRTRQRNGSHLISTRQSSTDIFLSNIPCRKPYNAKIDYKDSVATEEDKELFVKHTT